MSMSILLREIRSALTGYSGLTDLLPANKITFARRPQRDQLPGLTVTLGNVDYEPVTQSYAAATTYRVDITVFHKSAQECTAIHDQVKLAMLAANSSNFRIRLFDERYFVDVDNIHQGYVTVMWEMDTGVDTTDTVFLSPAFQGHDRMNVNYAFKILDGNTTTVSIDEQVYYLDYKNSSGQATHSVQLPEARQNLGKMYTFILGTNVDNNSIVRLLPYSGESVETAQSYDLNRAHSAVNIVAVQTSTGASPTYGWRVWAYHGLHD